VNGPGWVAPSSRLPLESFAEFDGRFVAPEIRQLSDIQERQARLAEVVSAEIVPRLAVLHLKVLGGAVAAETTTVPLAPSVSEIVHLAHLVLSPDVPAAATFVLSLRDRGLSTDTLFIELLEPAARHLGVMWERDECDFVDVTLGVGRLQGLLALFNATHDIPEWNERRKVLITVGPNEQHSFGALVVEKFLRAGAWSVHLELRATTEELADTVRGEWFAVVGIAAGSDARLDRLADSIAAIRAASCNPVLGIMVGGPLFIDRPDLAREIGADASAVNAPAAVVLAQKLFDIGAASKWTRPPM
jgi:methanogenic corrinoid protein MtbC1